MQRYGKILDFDGRINGQRIELKRAGESIWIELYGKNAIRFRSSVFLHINEQLNWTLLPPEKTPNCKVWIGCLSTCGEMPNCL